MARMVRGVFALTILVCARGGSAEIYFDMDGTGGYAPSRQLSPNGLLDFFEGSAVFAGALPVLADPVNTIGATVQSYVQAQLQIVVFNDGTIDSPFGNPPTEITMQAALPMLYTAFTGSELVFDVGAGVNFFRLFYDPTKDSNIVTGLGFDGSGDSFLILEATFTNLDFSVGTSLNTAEFLAYANVGYTHPDFFTVPPLVIMITLGVDGLVHIPPQIYPSAEIVGYTPSPFTDLRASMDLTARIVDLEIVPETTSLCLMGLGAFAAGAVAVRRRRRSA